MVSNASDDLPLPLSPVITTSRSRGMTRSMFFRLCCRAPRISMDSRGTVHDCPASHAGGAISLAGSRRMGQLPWHRLFPFVDGQGAFELDDLVAEQGGFFELELAGGLFHLAYEVADQAVHLVARQLGASRGAGELDPGLGDGADALGDVTDRLADPRRRDTVLLVVRLLLGASTVRL